MRINRFLAQATGMSRRAADTVIASGAVQVNGQTAATGHTVTANDTIAYHGKTYTLAQLQAPDATATVLFHKPAGYVTSREGQGSQTIYDILPPEYHALKPVGRLDKYSSGLLLLTNDGVLAHELTHPSRQKTKTYEVTLNQPLAPLHRQMIQDHGVLLDDGPSRFELERLRDGDDAQWRVTMHEGRNRQIRRTFKALGYHVTRLHRTHFGPYQLGGLKPGKTVLV